MADFGVCKYCGQPVIVDYPDEMEQVDRDNYASMNCNCPRARMEYDRELQIAKGKERVRELFGEVSVKLGFEPIECKPVMNALLGAVELVARGQMLNATFRLGGCTTAKIGKSAGKLIVERAVTNKYKLGE